jgi:sugar phosphate isomerase/epimerase
MKLSCLPVSFFADLTSGRMPVPEWAQMGVELGLDGIDLSIAWIADRSPAGVDALRRAIEDAGTQVVMLTSYPDFTHPDPGQRGREIDQAEDVVRVAAGLGAELLRVTAGQAHPETGREEGIAWAIAGLRELERRTRGSGVTLAYENHGKPGVWTYTDFSQPPDIFLEIADGTEDTSIGINFDVGNSAAFCDDPLALLEAVLPRVVSIHASDTALHGQLKHVLLGTGVTPYREIFERLVEDGWSRWICMEEASYQGVPGIAAAASFVRATWATAQAAVGVHASQA